jgi:hypothetical protein
MKEKGGDVDDDNGGYSNHYQLLCHLKVSLSHSKYPKKLTRHLQTIIIL